MKPVEALHVAHYKALRKYALHDSRKAAVLDDDGIIQALRFFSYVLSNPLPGAACVGLQQSERTVMFD